MTGSTGFALSPSLNTRRSRWVGRSAVLSSYPSAPKWLQSIALTSSFFGLQLVWSCEMAQASPFLLSLGVSKSSMAIVFVAGPLSGLLAQPLVGVWSDGCKSKFGRRRPFIFAGVVISSLSVCLLGWAKEVAAWFATEGGETHKSLSIFFAILSVYLIDFSVNVCQAMDRSLLVDVIPPADQPAVNAWAARMFGFGAVFGYGIGTVDLVRWTGGILGDEQLKVIAFFTVLFVCITHTITLTCVQERILISREDDEDEHKKSLLSGPKRALIEIWSTIRTIPKPIQSVFNVQFTSWLGWFPILFFTTTWIAELYVNSLTPTSYAELADAPIDIQEDATRAGTTAMFYHSVVSLFTSIVIPPFIAPSYPNPSKSTSTHPYSTTNVHSNTFARFVKKHLPFSWLSQQLLWTFSTGLFGVLLLVCSFTKSVAGATIVIALIGFCWSCTNWLPFSILADLILRTDSSSISDGRKSLVSPNPNSIMLQSSRSRHSSRVNASTSTANLHSTEDLDKTPKPPSSFVSQPRASPSQFTLQGSEGSSSSASTLNYSLPPTPHTATSVLSTSSSSSAYFDLPSTPGSPSHSISTPPLSNPYSNGTLSPLNSPQQPKISRKPRDRSSIASSYDFPPNNGNSYDFHSSSSPISSSSSEFQVQSRERREEGDGLNAFSTGGGGGGASTSTIRLPPEEGGEERRTVKIRHSDEFSNSTTSEASGRGGQGNDKRSFEFSSDSEQGEESDEEERGRRKRIPKIMIGDREEEEGDSESEDGDRRDGRWIHDEEEGKRGGENGGGDQAGVILGCHNIYLVLPQFLVTALSSIIFAILDPGKSVLGSHAPSTSDSATKTEKMKRAAVVGLVRLVRRAEEVSGGGGEKGYSSLSLIFQIGGIAALISTWICFRMWRDTEKEKRRMLRTRTGYGRVGS